MHRIELIVRDSEVYVGGIVHNSVYFNYLEHARNSYLRENKIDFMELATKRGVKFAQVSSEQQYKYPLMANDRFYITTKIEKATSIQFLFKQKIIRLPDEKLILAANTIGVLTNENGYPIRVPKDIEAILTEMGIK
ncbi:acyl-CoA thioesterase [bacterium]|nr:acyl-CoA thioesterase [bacterium]